MKSEEFNSSSAIYTTHKRNRKHSYREQQALCGLLLFCSPYWKTDNKDNRFSIENSDYAEILRHAVAVIEHARTEIARHVNGYVSTAYWEIGQILHERKIESGYGDSVVRRLSADLKERYPKMGVSPRQLWNMMKFYERYAGHDEKVLRSVALLPWSHNLLLLSKGLNDKATL